jgi:hypothetical protein
MESECAVRRRLFLVRSVAAAAAGVLPAHLDESPARMSRMSRNGGIGDADVPPTVISLADYGGTPGAERSMLIRAFGRAFASLADSGGGTLFVPAGVYDFGSYSDAAYIILCRNLRNIAISAYGATFKATTTARVMPNFFYFFNFSNITIAGASFTDAGFSPWFDWKGMYCVGIQADRSSCGFRMIDCFADRVLGLLASNNNAATRKYLSGVSVQGEVHDSYYGVGANFIRENVSVDLVCHNVRRAFIAYSLKNAKIVVTASSTDNWPGSNGLIALVSSGGRMGNVENVCVEVNVSGDCIHSSCIHFYHQGPEVVGYMRDIDATVNVSNANCTKNMFLFDHETAGIQPRTARVWDRISLHGKIPKGYTGTVIANRSKTTSPGTVYVDRNLAEMGNMPTLAAGFQVRSSRLMFSD